jgi:hypothetical protein
LSNPTSFWSVPTEVLLEELKASAGGLSQEAAKERLARYGLNRIKAKRRTDSLTLFLAHGDRHGSSGPRVGQGAKAVDIRCIRKFVITFGVVSLGVRLSYFRRAALSVAREDRSISNRLICGIRRLGFADFFIRTRQPFFKSKPGTLLWIATVLVILATVALPYTELSWDSGLPRCPLSFYWFCWEFSCSTLSRQKWRRSFFMRSEDCECLHGRMRVGSAV